MTPMYPLGARVRFVCAEMHFYQPLFYPPPGTIGTVVGYGCVWGEPDAEEDLLVQWPEGTTSADDLWMANRLWLEPVDGGERDET